MKVLLQCNILFIKSVNVKQLYLVINKDNNFNAGLKYRCTELLILNYLNNFLRMTCRFLNIFWREDNALAIIRSMKNIREGWHTHGLPWSDRTSRYAFVPRPHRSRISCRIHILIASYEYVAEIGSAWAVRARLRRGVSPHYILFRCATDYSLTSGERPTTIRQNQGFSLINAEVLFDSRESDSVCLGGWCSDRVISSVRPTFPLCEIS